MENGDQLPVPSASEYEAKAHPIVATSADVIGALAAFNGFVSPRRLDLALAVADSIGTILNEPSLVRVRVLRTISAPPDLDDAIERLKPEASNLSSPVRADLMREFAKLLVEVRPELSERGVDIAGALQVPLPERLKSESAGLLKPLNSFAERAWRLVRPENKVLLEARDLAFYYHEEELFKAVQVAQRTGDLSKLRESLPAAIDAIKVSVRHLEQSNAVHQESLKNAMDLEGVARQIEKVAQQRYAAITRRAIMLKRHLREDLNALTEDAAEEFEADFRRMSEKSGWFGAVDTKDLNDRTVIKNAERRYRNLVQRYQDQIDLLSREVSEFCEEFTRIADEALKPMARYEFRSVAPNAILELRIKAAVDRASTKTLVAGAAGAVVTGAAVNTGMIATAALASAAVTPVGMAIVGAVALAGVWKIFATPADRKRRDVRERTRELETKLRELIMSNLPYFENTVDAIVARFREAAIPDIAEPLVQASRIREISGAHTSLTRGISDAAKVHLDRLLEMMATLPPAPIAAAAAQSDSSPRT